MRRYVFRGLACSVGALSAWFAYAPLGNAHAGGMARGSASPTITATLVLLLAIQLVGYLAGTESGRHRTGIPAALQWIYLRAPHFWRSLSGVWAAVLVLGLLAYASGHIEPTYATATSAETSSVITYRIATGVFSVFTLPLIAGFFAGIEPRIPDLAFRDATRHSGPWDLL